MSTTVIKDTDAILAGPMQRSGELDEESEEPLSPARGRKKTLVVPFFTMVRTRDSSND